MYSLNIFHQCCIIFVTSRIRRNCRGVRDMECRAPRCANISVTRAGVERGFGNQVQAENRDFFGKNRFYATENARRKIRKNENKDNGRV